MRDMFVRFGGVLFLAALAIWLYALLDAATADRAEVRKLPKGLWVVLILVTFAVGAIAWMLWGRPVSRPRRPPVLGSSGRSAWPARPGRPAESTGLFGGARLRPAPDDDPEFLAGLERRAAEEHEKLLGSWEDDLRRREEELRRRRGDGSDDPSAG